MRSRTEARFAAMLDREGLKWDYEPFCLADQHGQWLPDFEVHIDAKRTFVDVKGSLSEAVVGLPKWTRIANNAMPDEKLRVLGAGYADPMFPDMDHEAVEYRPNGLHPKGFPFVRFYFHRDPFWFDLTDEKVAEVFSPSVEPPSAFLPPFASTEARLALPPAP